MYERLLNDALKFNKLHIPNEQINLFDIFLKNKMKQGFVYMNPYDFKEFSKLSKEESVQIFLMFVDDFPLFELIAFIQCPHCMEEKIINNNVSNLIMCSNCSVEIRLDNIKREEVYITFKIKDKILLDS